MLLGSAGLALFRVSSIRMYAPARAMHSPCVMTFGRVTPRHYADQTPSPARAALAHCVVPPFARAARLPATSTRREFGCRVQGGLVSVIGHGSE